MKKTLTITCDKNENMWVAVQEVGRLLDEGFTSGIDPNWKISEGYDAKILKEKIEMDIAVNQEMQIIPESGQAWTQEYKEGYIDGLKRSLELFDPIN